MIEAVISTTAYANNACNSPLTAEKVLLKVIVFVALIPVISTGNNMGKDNTVNSAPFALALEMIAAIIVAPADNPILPINRMTRKTVEFSTE